MTKENKALVRRWFDEVLASGDVEQVDKLFAPNYVLHGPTIIREVYGHEGVKRYVARYRAAYPDVCFIVEDQIAEDDMVVTRWTARGSHRGEFLGIPPTGEQMTMTGIEFDHVVAGKIEEAWVSYHIFTDGMPASDQAKQMLAMMQYAFPDLDIAPVDRVTEGDKVASRWMMSGTHEGEFMGVVPTGKRVTVMGMDIVRMADGEILDYWGEFDVMDMLRQVGITPPSRRVES